ncbi:arylmalonate decarboxylase [Nonomuraea sp. K274]|uniref:Arylmalonate decarboxylase n=1 Tax=Nonomuraea cypriaca TaxID=1187855 RepID=A0A931A6V1_9ACTN|nr:arylmalonate decarboxylase [Nonomuraea cypriaca]MBF8187452.1 arylmalonate decarboxylase [Nonomuraea cypriaca]
MSRGRVGVIVAPANPSAEPELTRLLGSRADMHVTRFPVRHGTALAERLESYNSALPAMVWAFDGLQLNALVMACSEPRYLLGPDEDRDQCARLGEATGVPFASATLATREAMEHAQVSDIVLVSPYQPWLTDLAERFWKTAGLNVTQVLQVRAKDGYSPYAVTPRELISQVELAELPGDAVLLFTGTGMATLPVLERLSTGNDRVLLTSNLCTAWWALSRALGRPVTLNRVPYRRHMAAQGRRTA